MIFELADDYAQALAVLPAAHAKHRLLEFYEEAVRRNIHFIHRHRDDYPIALFQCLWNLGAWELDAVEDASVHAEFANAMRAWRHAREVRLPGAKWVRSVRPPSERLGGHQRMVLRGHEHHVYGVAFAAEEPFVVSGAWDKTARVWSTTNGMEISSFRGHSESVDAVTVLPGDQWIASASHDGSIRIWEAATGTERHCLQLGEGWVGGMFVSRDGRTIAGSNDGILSVWDVETGEQQLTIQTPSSAVGYSHDGTRIVTGGGAGDGMIRVWNAENGELLAEWTGHNGSFVRDVAYAHRDDRIASVGGDGTVRVWDSESFRELHRLSGHDEITRDVAWYPGDDRLVSSCDHSVRWWDASTGAELYCLKTNDFTVNALAVSNDGLHIACACSHMTVRIWDADFNRIQPSARDDGDVIDATFSPDGNRLATSWGSHFEIQVWDTRTGTDLWSLAGHEDDVYSLAFSPCGGFLASGSADKTVRLWDLAAGKQTACFHGHEEVIWDIAFKDTGNRLAAGSRDGTIIVWDVESGAELARRLKSMSNFVGIEFFPDDSAILIHGTQGRRLIWDLNSECCVHLEGPLQKETKPSVGYTVNQLVPEMDTIFQDNKTGQIVGRYPIFLDHFAVGHLHCPIPGIWALSDGVHRFGAKTTRLHLLCLEGIE